MVVLDDNYDDEDVSGVSKQSGKRRGLVELKEKKMAAMRAGSKIKQMEN